MYALALAVLTMAPAQPAKHETENALFKNLIETGIDVGAKEKVKFQAPTMPDGLDKDKQTAIIKTLISGAIDYAEFTRDAINAPSLIGKIRTIPGAANAPARGVDVWFVVHGDFKLLEDDKFLDKLAGGNKSGGKGGQLKKEELAARKIVIADEKRESYGHIEFDFLDKVRLTATGHAMWSRNGESVVAAAEIDPRFTNDKDYPNQWRSITKEGGQVKIGNPNPWNGAAMYLKVTKLHEPAGAMFIEQHIIFVEPTGWFGGEPLLTSKLPVAVKDNVATIRKEFKRGK